MFNKISFIIIAFFSLLLITKICRGQENMIKDGVKVYKSSIMGNVGDWQNSGVKVKKGEHVLIEVTGKVNYGFWIRETDATGFNDHMLMISYNKPEFLSFRHGVVICKNSNENVPVVNGYTVIENMDETNKIPEIFKKRLSDLQFTGNYFVSAVDQEVQFIINDKKISDNSGVFDVNIYVISSCPDLDGLFDMAKLIFDNNGALDFCLKDNCANLVNEDGSFFKGGVNSQGHYYLAVNPLDNNQIDASTAMNVLCKSIFNIFPGGAADVELSQTPERSEIIFNHYYDLTNLKIKKLDLRPRVRVTKLTPFYFIFEATGQHVFKGTAIHGVFTDKCGDLYMFQQGRGLPEEYMLQREGNLISAEFMWKWMANNLKQLL